MPDILKRLKDQLLTMWSKLDKNQKSRLLISAALILAAVVAVGIYSTQKNYVPVFVVSDPQDLSAIEAALTEKKIAYEYGQNSAILVDKKDKNAAEFAIAAVPSLSSTVSIEDTWSKIRMSSTESDKTYLWRDFKKNSLIAKLKMFDNVEDADVDLSIPQQTAIFSALPQQTPTAFVRIKARGEITASQVQGIASVVASSIGGMKPEDVTVVDSNFNPLNGSDRDPVMGTASSQYEIRQRVKQDMEQSVRSLYLGDSEAFDYINVVANPVLDFDRQAQVENEVKKPTDLDEAIISNTSLTETIKNGAEGGVPGIDENPGQVENRVAGENAGSDYEKTTSTTNFDYTRSVKEYEKAIGTVNYANSSLTVALWFGDRVTDEEKLDDAFLERLRADVSSATGVPVGKISVNKYRMAPKEEIQKTTAEFIKELVDTYGLFAVVVLMLLAFVIVVPKTKVVKETQEAASELALATAIDTVVGDEMTPLDFDQKSEVLRQLEQFIQDKPDAVVLLLRNWLRDDYDY